MISPLTEKRILQCVVALACVVPVAAGLSGILRGVALLGGGTIAMDSHFRYLSGLLLGIGLGFLSAIPNIEQRSARFRLLTCIVVTGGLGRLLGLLEMGVPDFPMIFALAMELMVAPLLCLWQGRVSRRF